MEQALANLLLNYFAQDGHEARPGERDGYREWVLETLQTVWTEFRRKFLDLWRRHGTGDAYPASLFQDAGEGIDTRFSRAFKITARPDIEGD